MFYYIEDSVINKTKKILTKCKLCDIIMLEKGVNKC